MDDKYYFLIGDTDFNLAVAITSGSEKKIVDDLKINFDRYFNWFLHNDNDKKHIKYRLTRDLIRICEDLESVKHVLDAFLPYFDMDCRVINEAEKQRIDGIEIYV